LKETLPELRIEERSVSETKIPEPAQITVLLIEDEEDIRRLVSFALERSNFRVLQAKDADEAQDVWQKENSTINLAIVDILIPGMSGLDVVTQFRQTRPDLKIIFASGNVRESVIKTAHVVRGAKFIMKPYSIKSLMELIRTTIESM
jgi:two-component system, cell cycle sensor histidine kinase and response regulator CckA